MRARGVYASCISRHEVPRRDRVRFKINATSGAPGAPRARARSGVGQGVLPFAARGRRSAPRPPHGTRPGAVDACVGLCAARADPSLNTIENICYSRSWSGVAVHGRRMQPRETRARRRQYTRRKTYNLLPKGVYNSRRRLALIDAANACGRAP